MAEPAHGQGPGEGPPSSPEQTLPRRGTRSSIRSAQQQQQNIESGPSLDTSRVDIARSKHNIQRQRIKKKAASSAIPATRVEATGESTSGAAAALLAGAEAVAPEVRTARSRDDQDIGESESEWDEALEDTMLMELESDLDEPLQHKPIVRKGRYRHKLSLRDDVMANQEEAYEEPERFQYNDHNLLVVQKLDRILAKVSADRRGATAAAALPQQGLHPAQPPVEDNDLTQRLSSFFDVPLSPDSATVTVETSPEEQHHKSGTIPAGSPRCTDLHQWGGQGVWTVYLLIQHRGKREHRKFDVPSDTFGERSIIEAEILAPFTNMVARLHQHWPHGIPPAGQHAIRYMIIEIAAASVCGRTAVEYGSPYWTLRGKKEGWAISIRYIDRSTGRTKNQSSWTASGMELASNAAPIPVHAVFVQQARKKENRSRRLIARDQNNTWESLLPPEAADEADRKHAENPDEPNAASLRAREQFLRFATARLTDTITTHGELQSMFQELEKSCSAHREATSTHLGSRYSRLPKDRLKQYGYLSISHHKSTPRSTLFRISSVVADALGLEFVVENPLVLFRLNSKERAWIANVLDAHVAACKREPNILAAIRATAEHVDTVHNLIDAGMELPEGRCDCTDDIRGHSFHVCGNCLQYCACADLTLNTSAVRVCPSCLPEPYYPSQATVDSIRQAAYYNILEEFAQLDIKDKDLRKSLADDLVQDLLPALEGCARRQFRDGYTHQIITESPLYTGFRLSVEAVHPWTLYQSRLITHAPGNVLACIRALNLFKHASLVGNLQECGEIKRTGPSARANVRLNRRVDEMHEVQMGEPYRRSKRPKKLTEEQIMTHQQQWRSGKLIDEDGHTTSQLQREAFVEPRRVYDGAWEDAQIKTISTIVTQIADSFGAPLDKAIDGCLWPKRLGRCPEWWTWDVLYQLCRERWDRMFSKCNSYWDMYDSYLTLALEIYYGLISGEGAESRIIGLPIRLWRDHLFSLSLAHKHHGKALVSGWSQDPKTSNDRDPAKNNMVIMSSGDNKYAADFPEREYRALAKLIAKIQIDEKYYQPDLTWLDDMTDEEIEILNLEYPQPLPCILDVPETDTDDVASDIFQPITEAHILAEPATQAQVLTAPSDTTRAVSTQADPRPWAQGLARIAKHYYDRPSGVAYKDRTGGELPPLADIRGMEPEENIVGATGENQWATELILSYVWHIISEKLSKVVPVPSHKATTPAGILNVHCSGQSGSGVDARSDTSHEAMTQALDRFIAEDKDYPASQVLKENTTEYHSLLQVDNNHWIHVAYVVDKKTQKGETRCYDSLRKRFYPATAKIGRLIAMNAKGPWYKYDFDRYPEYPPAPKQQNSSDCGWFAFFSLLMHVFDQPIDLNEQSWINMGKDFRWEAFGYVYEEIVGEPISKLMAEVNFTPTSDAPIVPSFGPAPIDTSMTIPPSSPGQAFDRPVTPPDVAMGDEGVPEEAVDISTDQSVSQLVSDSASFRALHRALSLQMSKCMLEHDKLSAGNLDEADLDKLSLAEDFIIAMAEQLKSIRGKSVEMISAKVYLYSVTAQKRFGGKLGVVRVNLAEIEEARLAIFA